MKVTTKFWIALVVLAILSPIGLILPQYFNAGAAWGEWATDEIGKFVGYIPFGLAKLSAFWIAPIPDYAFKGSENASLPISGISYIISAVLGMGLIVVIVLVIGKIFIKKE